LGIGEKSAAAVTTEKFCFSACQTDIFILILLLKVNIIELILFMILTANIAFFEIFPLTITAHADTVKFHNISAIKKITAV
jgi:hypothetical protein